MLCVTRVALPIPGPDHEWNAAFALSDLSAPGQNWEHIWSVTSVTSLRDSCHLT